MRYFKKQVLIKTIIFTMTMLSVLPNTVINLRAITIDEILEKHEIDTKFNILNANITLENKDTVEYHVEDGNVINITEEQNRNIIELKERIAEERRIAEEQERKRREYEAKTAMSVRNISYSDISEYTDLVVMNTITVEQVNHIIEYWSKKSGSTPFLNNGQVFIDASKQSGLDPIYILAHAALESAWGKLSMSHNYFGIGAFDSNPSNGHNYGNDSLYDGIVNGAVWIKKNYYDRGQTSLYNMRYNNGRNEYCTSSTWATEISNIIRISYSLIQ